jgi:eukaryotic-like serine/threonine-protein kinase
MKLAGGGIPEPHRPPRATSSPDPVRFLPGVLLAGRYRIIGLLGKGGMGEVYRADDLKLGQPVALKFLPAGFDAEPARLERFLQEVRTARQVSHANVCRVYDVGDAEGLHFLSMEFVDGEDLASLLRRIGHLPKEKAIQIARQLCAGLAAAHEAGVLHRDLKPANVMIDGRGRARITDFGLAGLAEQIEGGDILAGTPAYMAPEQISGREVSVRSDVYSLGLVLYELFTGKPVFRAASRGELMRLQSETTPTSPSSFLEGFDPAVERVILRCLDNNPSRRPPSALAVAAALPGGDPLAAALAAGETPSPELVAEAGEKGAAPAALAWSALALFLVSVAAIVVLSPRTELLGMTRLDKPPQFLAERAAEILRQAGYDREPADSLFTFQQNGDYLAEMRRRKAAVGGSTGLPPSSLPPPILFWYRQSPSELVTFSRAVVGNLMADPPFTLPGMARIALDPDGRLESLLVVPDEHMGKATVAEPDWGPLLLATGMDQKSLSPAEPEWAPPVFTDRRAAWTGSRPGSPGTPLRIEAAAAGGKAVALRIIGPWTHPAEEPSPPRSLLQRAGGVLSSLWFVAVVMTAGIVAVRNVRRGRGDRRGALRLALYLGAARMAWFIAAHHVAAPDEVEIFIGHLSYAMMRVGLAYVFYLAVEPYARRLWPRMLVSWVRVLEGRFRDPLVGRDLLLGCAGGALATLIQRLVAAVFSAFGGGPPLFEWSVWTEESLRGSLHAIVSLVGVHTQQLLEVIFPFTMLLILRLLLRRTSWAVAGVSLGAVVMFAPASGLSPDYVVTLALILSIFWLLLFRVGLLALAVLFNVSALLATMPLTPSPAGWYLGTMLLVLAAVIAPAIYGFWTSQAGRPLFRDEILEPAAGR